MYSTLRLNREVVSQLTDILLILADENLCALVHSMLKNEYFQRGGHDPEILAQIRDLEYEAQRMQATQRPQGIKDNEYFSLNICSCDWYTFVIHLLAQSIEHYTSITEVMGSNLAQGWIFFKPYFHHCLSRLHTFSCQLFKARLHLINKGHKLWSQLKKIVPLPFIWRETSILRTLLQVLRVPPDWRFLGVSYLD